MSASAAMMGAARDALAAIEGLNGAYDGPPLTASLPYATIEAGPESDRSWKGGVGRELRLAAMIRDGGERPERPRRLMEAAESALAEIDGETGGWRVVNCLFLRSRLARAGKEWTGLMEFRARMIRVS